MSIAPYSGGQEDLDLVGQAILILWSYRDKNGYYEAVKWLLRRALAEITGGES